MNLGWRKSIETPTKSAFCLFPNADYWFLFFSFHYRDFPSPRIAMPCTSIEIAVTMKEGRWEISRFLGKSAATISRIIKSYHEEGHLYIKSKPRRPQKTTEKDKRMLVRMSRVNSKIASRQLKLSWAVGEKVSNVSVKKILTRGPNCCPEATSNKYPENCSTNGKKSTRREIHYRNCQVRSRKHHDLGFHQERRPPKLAVMNGSLNGQKYQNICPKIFCPCLEEVNNQKFLRISSKPSFSCFKVKRIPH